MLGYAYIYSAYLHLRECFVIHSSQMGTREAKMFDDKYSSVIFYFPF